MPNSNPNKITMTVTTNRDVLQAFDLQYPRCRSRFIDNALKLATNDRDLFDKIFFCDIMQK